jgi:hypothetical protein
VEGFKKWASAFAAYEEEALKIHIKETDRVYEIFPGYSNVKVDPRLERLRLEGLDYRCTLMFTPSEHRDLDEGQKRFLRRLRHVLMNSEPQNDNAKYEAYVQSMVDSFLQECKLDDGEHLEISPSRLKLRISGKKFATHSDKQGVKDGRLIWVLQESKHSSHHRYKNGEIQLVSALIAACQENYSFFPTDLLPQIIYGIDVKGDQLYVLRAVITEEYILSLYGGLPKQTLEVKKYPRKLGLKPSSPKGRGKIISLMLKLREHALSISTHVLIDREKEEGSDDEE